LARREEISSRSSSRFFSALILKSVPTASPQSSSLRFGCRGNLFPLGAYHNTCSANGKLPRHGPDPSLSVQDHCGAWPVCRATLCLSVRMDPRLPAWSCVRIDKPKCAEVARQPVFVPFSPRSAVGLPVGLPASGEQAGR
jgi:hypothetical protein